MIDSTLKFKNVTEMQAALTLVGWDEEEGSTDPTILFDIIGVYYITTGTPDAPIYTKQDGYFVNMRVLSDDTDVSVLSKYVVVMDPPIRVWA